MFPNDARTFTRKVDGTGEESLIRSQHYNDIRTELLTVQSVVQQSLLYAAGARITVVSSWFSGVEMTNPTDTSRFSKVWPFQISVPNTHSLFTPVRNLLESKWHELAVFAQVTITQPTGYTKYPTTVNGVGFRTGTRSPNPTTLTIVGLVNVLVPPGAPALPQQLTGSVAITLLADQTGGS